MDARVYERTIYSNASPSSKVFQTTLKKTKSQLLTDTLHEENNLNIILFLARIWTQFGF